MKDPNICGYGYQLVYMVILSKKLLKLVIYYATNIINGDIYEKLSDEDEGDVIIGHYIFYYRTYARYR